MNQTIQTINHWGARFQEFAWPMLWQSSLLILIVLALDWALARKIRASVRHALWLVVLVKLLLPPTLALPTGIAWWLTPANHETPDSHKYTVTYSQIAAPIEMNFPMVPLPKPPPPQLNRAGEILLGATAISAALLAWLILRWIQVAALVRRATAAPALTDSLAAAQRRICLRRHIRLKLVDDRLSPAVCGLFRPVILLPRLLAERLTENQLQAVLLHELIHLRRWDIWMNCAQALLQILYWWHPLVWLANSRLRRVREEAVDDAVMLALDEDAELYAPTLLEVAKLAFHRPSLSLGLVGIMESRSALCQRIERLMEFRAPRRAGLTVLSVLGVFAFSAVALPMGSAPQADLLSAAPEVATPAATAPTSGAPVVRVTDDPKLFRFYPYSNSSNPPTVLITAHFYRIPTPVFEKFVTGLNPQVLVAGQGPWWSVSPGSFPGLQDSLLSSGIQPVASPRAQTSSDTPVEMFIGNATNSLTFDCVPTVDHGAVRLYVSAELVDQEGTGMITNRFRVQAAAANGGGLVIRPNDLKSSPSGDLVAVIGVNFLTNPTARTAVAAIDPNTGLPIAGSSVAAIDPQTGLPVPGGMGAGPVDPRTGLPIAGDGAGPVDANTGLPIAADTNQLFTRVYQVDTNFFPRSLRDTIERVPAGKIVMDPGTDVSAMARTLFHLSGIDLVSPPGKAVFYKDSTGLLLVKATESDLDTMDRLIAQVSYVAPQIHIKARFYRVPSGTMDGLTRFLNGVTNTDSGITGILTPDHARAVMKTLPAVKGAEVLAEPEVVTTTGRQTQMRSTQVVTILTNAIYVQNPTNPNNGSVVMQTEKIETGPVFDVIPYLLADGYTISLQAVATDTEFYGYPQPPKHSVQMATNALGQTIPLPTIWPVLQIHENRALVNLYDDQSFLMVLDRVEIPTFGSTDKKRAAAVAKHIADADKKNHTEGQIIVLVTATAIDAAGNRVHTDYMDFQRASIPSQTVPTMLPPQRWQKDYFDNPPALRGAGQQY